MSGEKAFTAGRVKTTTYIPRPFVSDMFNFSVLVYSTEFMYRIWIWIFDDNKKYYDDDALHLPGSIVTIYARLDFP